MVGDVVVDLRIDGGVNPEDSRRRPGVSGDSMNEDFRVLLIGSGGNGIVGGAAGGA